MVFSTVTEVCNYHPNFLLGHFHHPRNLPVLYNPPIPSQTLESLRHVLPKDWPILDVSHKWSHDAVQDDN